jgi:stearoyl-CoA desaturase (delta-9 desaturase)
MNAKPAELPVSEGPAAPAKVVNALRLQRRLALAVVIVPILGTLIAIVLVIKNGIGFVEIGSFAVMYLLTMGGVTIGFHRYFAHKCFDAGPITSLVLGVLGSMAAQGPIISWVTVHRKHHAFSDRPGDPHSPHISRGRNLGGLVGLWHAHIGWMLSENFTEWVNFARDLMADRRIFRIQRMYFLWVALGLALPAAGAGLLSRSWAGAGLGFLWGGLVRCFVVNQSSWCVGSVCHYFGSQRFETHDHSANNYVVAMLTFGEGLQNNHHAFPSAARHGIAWWEPDFSGTLIHLLAFAGLIKNLNHPTKEAIARLRKI